MNHQSDYGYATGGIEFRDFAFCVRQAKACRRLAWRYRGTDHAAGFRRQCGEWVTEARRHRALAS